MDYNPAALTGYIRLVEAGRRGIDEVPEPYKEKVKKALNL